MYCSKPIGKIDLRLTKKPRTSECEQPGEQPGEHTLNEKRLDHVSSDIQ
jgi:hypothetical protein